MKNTNTSNTSLSSQRKDNTWFNELQTIFHYLIENMATASMVEAATGVKQKNICRYKRDLEKAGRLWEIEKKACKVTGFKAWYLTTDKGKAPISKPQLNLF